MEAQARCRVKRYPVPLLDYTFADLPGGTEALHIQPAVETMVHGFARCTSTFISLNSEAFYMGPCMSLVYRWMELKTRVCWEQRIFTALLAEEQVKQQSKHKEYYYVCLPGQELAVSIPFCACKQLSFLVHLIDLFGFVLAELVLVQSCHAAPQSRNELSQLEPSLQIH